MSSTAKTFYEFGPFRLDAYEQQLWRDGAEIHLTPKAFGVLFILVRRSGRTLLKDELIREVWPDSFVEENNLADNISTLRKALGDDRIRPKYIETVPRRGYRFIAAVTEVRDEDDYLFVEESIHARVVVEESNEDVESLVHSVQGARLQYEPRGTESGPRLRSIAVLPFNNLGAGDEYLGLGITDALITRLGNLKQMIVRPTSAVLKYADAGEPSLTAGRELMVDDVMDGKIQRCGERIRVTVQLADVREGSLLWAEKYDGDFTDIFAIEDHITEQVTRTLMLNLNAGERQRLTTHSTGNIAAYQEYLKGRYHWNRFTPEGFSKALGCFVEAIRLDPAYALAHAGLAEYYLTAGFWGSLAPNEAFTKGKSESLAALEIDNNLAEAHSSLAYARMVYDWDWRSAHAGFERALEINPHSSATRLWHTHYLLMVGRFDEALTEVNHAKEIDPLSPFIHALHGFCFYIARRPLEALEELHKAHELNPDFAVTHYAMAQAYRLMGRYDEAVIASEKAVALSHGGAQMITGQLGYNLALAGREREAREVIAQFKQLSEQCYVSTYHIGAIHAGLGEIDEAFKHLYRAREQRDLWLTWLRSEPIMDNLRSDPRFQDLLQSMNFPQ